MTNTELLAKIAALHNEAISYVNENKRNATAQAVNELSAINRTALLLQRICLQHQYDPKTMSPQPRVERKALGKPEPVKPTEQPKESEQPRSVLATNSEKDIEKAKSTRSKKAKTDASNND